MCSGGHSSSSSSVPPPPPPPPPPPVLQNPSVINRDNPSSLSSEARFRNSLRIDLGGIEAPAAPNGPGSLYLNPAPGVDGVDGVGGGTGVRGPQTPLGILNTFRSVLLKMGQAASAPKPTVGS